MNTKNIFSLAALSIAMVACSSDNDMTSAVIPSQKGKIVTLTTTLEARNATTRTLTDNGDGTISSAWEVGSEIRVQYQNTSGSESESTATIQSVDEYGNAMISAQLVDPKEDSQVHFWYPFRYPNHTQGQDGTLDLINRQYDFMHGQGNMVFVDNQATLPDGIHMNHNNSILKLTISDGTTDITKDIKKLDIVINWIENEEGRGQSYSLLNLSSLSTIYVAFNLPGHIDLNVDIYAETTSGDKYHTAKSGVRLQGGKMYTATPLTMSPYTGVNYLVWENGRLGQKVATDYKILTKNFIEEQGGELSSGWYVLNGEVNYDSTIKFTGDANLILSDNSILSMSGSGNIDASGHVLNIYAQSIYGESEIEPGKLNIYCDNGTALQAGNLNVHGGIIEASTYADNNSGIIADNINVYGGKLSARGGNTTNGTGGYGIGSGTGGTISVTGGELHASGGDGFTGETSTPGKAIQENLEPVIGENLYYYEGDIEDEEEMTIKTTSPYTCTKQFVVIKEQTVQNGD